MSSVRNSGDAEKQEDGLTPLQRMMDASFSTDDAMNLVRLGADVNLKNSSGMTLLQILMLRENNINGKNDEAIRELVTNYQPDIEKAFDIDTSFRKDTSKLLKGDKIGKGAFSKVYLTTFNGRNVAVKQLTVHKDAELSNALKNYPNELKSMCALSSGNDRGTDHITKIIGYDMQLTGPDYRFTIIMEYASRGSLCDIINHWDGVPPSWKRRYMISSDIACGLSAVHRAGFIHGDLKVANILVNNEWDIKISDFGLAMKDAPNKNRRGTSYYIAPEVHKQEGHTTKSDVYSFAITMFVIGGWMELKKMLQKTPDTLEEIATSTIEGRRLSFQRHCNPKMAAMITWGWRTNPDNRPTTDQLCEEFDAGIDDISERLKPYLRKDL